MPYTDITLSQYISRISSLMDDTGAQYWTVPEIRLAVWEALRVWGAYTNYWRDRGTFSISPSDPTPYYDLSSLLPTLRSRSYTLGQMVKEMQLCLLEAANGISGSGMSGQVSVGALLTAIQVARNRFVLDAHLPISVHSAEVNPPPLTGMVEFSQSSVFVHRASWLDKKSGAWTNLWREDAWSIDKGNPEWTVEPGLPRVYSEAENAPLKMQLSPAPSNVGTLETLSVDSFDIDLTNSNATFGVPDEWVHAIKYSALSYLLYGEGQIKDPLRAEYAESRYQQAVGLAKDARSVIRLLVNNLPISLDSLASVDAGSPYWRNQSGPPQGMGVLYDILTCTPGIPSGVFGAAVDVVRSAPLPSDADFMPVGGEELDHITDEVTHTLVFKCGGQDFKSTFQGHDSFMKAVALRNGVSAAKIKYISALFGQPQKEWRERPDRVEV